MRTLILAVTIVLLSGCSVAMNGAITSDPSVDAGAKACAFGHCVETGNSAK